MILILVAEDVTQKVAEASGTVVQCSKCSAFSTVAKACKISTATVIIEGSDGKEHQATVFDDIEQISSFSDQRDCYIK